MRYLIFSVCILYVASGVLGQQTNCTGREDFTISYSCRQYEACRNQTYVSVQCPEGQYVDLDRLVCDDPENVDPPCGQARNCTGLPTGDYPDYEFNCTSFYSCLNGQHRGTELCPAGLVFDPSGQFCNWIYNVCPPCGTNACLTTPAYTGPTTEESSTPTPVINNCTGLADGFYPEDGCNYFFRCENGVQSNRNSCPTGTVFDPVDNVCDFPGSACPPCGTGADVTAGYCKDCSSVADGVYADETVNCLSYFTCYKGLMRGNDQCPSGEVYDPDRGACTSDVEDVCPPCYNGSSGPPARCDVTTAAEAVTTAEESVTTAAEAVTTTTGASEDSLNDVNNV